MLSDSAVVTGTDFQVSTLEYITSPKALGRCGASSCLTGDEESERVEEPLFEAGGLALLSPALSGVL